MTSLLTIFLPPSRQSREAFFFEKIVVRINSHANKRSPSLTDSGGVLRPLGTPDNSPPFQGWVSGPPISRVPTGTTDCQQKRQIFVKSQSLKEGLSPLTATPSRNFAFNLGKDSVTSRDRLPSGQPLNHHEGHEEYRQRNA